MPRMKADAAMQHTIDFTDHAGRPAKATWSDRKHKVLPPLSSLCFYFVHPVSDLDDLDLRSFWRDIKNGHREGFRFEIFCIPGGSNNDCAQHYRKELEARGDVFEQVREVNRAMSDPEYAATRKPQGKLPGLVSSHRHPGALSYHGLVIVYKDVTWNREDDDKTFDVVQFGPALTSDDYEPGDEIVVQEPLKTTRVRATSKSEIERYEDQGVWSWFTDHKPSNWWYDVYTATNEAGDLGWTSW
ncbi:hypothetical protein FLONG3_3232 [Fusarium longipes]|uniref:Uncharacterized protein n=1 Tax=Fusarium longipes TaxID=694270 RepID=A0A395T1R1_9HYPO|nr:hypothetical protein FLONG3_3232 [Fusarium longipes]